MTQTNAITDQTAYLAERCRTAWEQHNTASKRRVALTATLQRTLSPDIYRLVMEAVDADGAMSNAWAEATICEVARHLPAFAPSLPMIWEHCADMRVTDQERCCVVADSRAPA